MAKVKKAVKKTTITRKTKELNPKTPKAMLKVKAIKSVFKSPKLSIPKAPYKKSEFLGALSAETDVAKKEVAKVLEAIQTDLAPTFRTYMDPILFARIFFIMKGKVCRHIYGL